MNVLITGASRGVGRAIASRLARPGGRVIVNYVRSADEHQDRLARCPDDYCHIPDALLRKYRS